MSDGNRMLISMEKLPVRTGTLDRDQADKDIREAINVLERRLYDRASQYHVGGYEPEEPEYEHGGDHTIVGKMRLVRSA